MKEAFAIFILTAVAGVGAAVENWLDARGFDRVSAALLGVIASGLVILMIALALYFGGPIHER